ncbi:MAG: hypothetical protein AAF585_11395 [Verrucomicrobiota bacterium]
MKTLPTYFVRRPSGLYALRLELIEQHLPEIPIHYVVRRRKLTRSIAEAVPGGAKLRRAWSKLAQATRSESTLDSLNIVLRNCAPVPCRHLDPVPQLHPRYPHDIQPWLADPNAIADIIEQLTGEQPKLDPYIGWNHPWGLPELSGVVREQLFPLTPLAKDETLLNIVSLVQKHPQIIDRLAVLLALLDWKDTADWIKLLLTNESKEFSHQTENLLTLILETRAFAQSAPKRFQHKLNVIENTAYKGDMLVRALLELTAERRDPDYFIDGLEMDQRYDYDHRYDCWKSRAERPKIGAPTVLIRMIAGRVGESAFAFELMELCAEFEGMNRFIRLVEHSYLTDERRVQLLKWTHALRHKDCWPRFLTEAPLIIETLHHHVPEDYTIKYLDLIMGLSRHNVDGLIPDVISFVRRICQPPFSKASLDGNACCVIRSFQHKRAMAYLEKADEAVLRRWNDACLDFSTVWGLKRIADISPYLLIRGFRFCSKRLIQAAEIIGAFEKANWLRTSRIWKQHPLMSLPITKMRMADLVILLESVWRGDGPSPIPKAVRKHISGEKLLEAHRSKHYRMELDDTAAKYALRVLQQLLDRALITSKAEEDLKSYSLIIAGEAKENRRPLRRFFRDWKFCGAKTDDHPINARWLNSQFTKKRQQLWARGLSRRLEDLDFRVEQDPEEILRMGGYVDSCLAVGGLYSWSTPANLLDANKRVIFARRDDGRFAGRQLVVVSEEGELIFYDVYPCDLPKNIVRAFAVYDVEFAKELKLPLWNNQDSYQVEKLVSNDWYEDCEFDPIKILNQKE